MRTQGTRSCDVADKLRGSFGLAVINRSLNRRKIARFLSCISSASIEIDETLVYDMKGML